MQILFLLPFFISLYFVMRKEVEKAFLNVYLPLIFIVPTGYNIRLPHLPTISAGSAALIPIGVSLLIWPKQPWKLRRMDLWIGLFMASIFISEVFREVNPKDGLVVFAEDLVEMLLAYVVGRQIFEPDLRLAAVKRIIFLLTLQTPLALYEWRFGVNPYMKLGAAVFGMGSGGWFVQLRGGAARISTCFEHAILAGMMFGVGLALNYYLEQIYKMDKTRLGPKMSMLQKYHIPLLALIVMLYLTGSRGPQACAVISLIILQIPRFKNIKLAAAVILSLLVIGGAIGYSAFQSYIDIKAGAATDEAQTSALYRKQLLENYAPYLEQGGWLGYGSVSAPRVMGQISIDNHYLLLQLGQGKLGEYTFILLAIEAMLTLMITATRVRSKETLFLVFSLMGAILGLFLAVKTVSLFEQGIQVLFMLLGWSQTVVDVPVFGRQPVAEFDTNAKFRFKRVVA